MSQCCIGLGGNTGPVALTLAAALRELTARGVAVRDVSRLYRSRPMGPAAAPFLNACISAETTLPAEELLTVLKQIEAAAGRKAGERWSARTLDLDVLMMEEQVIHTSMLTVPHPGVFYRRFVLDPLHDIAADLIVPQTGRSVAELRRRLLQRPLPVALCGGVAQHRERIEAAVRQSYPDVRLVSEKADAPISCEAIGLNLDQNAAWPQRSRGSAIPVEGGLGSLDAAVCAMIDSMLDDPECTGELPRP